MSTVDGAKDRGVTIVLVHGACHGAWCWEDVAGPLASHGWDVEAVELPLTSLYEDTEVLRSTVQSARHQHRKVLVVAHSYGGFVVSEGGHDADRLVFCAAFLPDSGQSAQDIVGDKTPEGARAVAVAEDGQHVFFRPEYATAALYNECTAEQAEAAISRLRPIHLNATVQPVHEPAAWLVVPSSYLVSTKDCSINPSYQYARAKELDFYRELDADHSPFYSAPAELVERLDELATQVSNDPDASVS